MGNLIRNAIGVFSIPLASSFAYETYQFLAANLDSLVTNWFVYGVFAYAVVHVIAGNRIHFIRVLEHELGHMVMAFAFFQEVVKLTVELNEVNGEVRARGTYNSVIALAPYFLPLFTIPFLIIKPFIFASVHNVIDLLIGFTLAFHYFGLVHEYRPKRQPDIRESGQIFAFVVTVLLNVLFLVIVLSVVLDDFSHLSTYFGGSIARTRETYLFVVNELHTRIFLLD